MKGKDSTVIHGHWIICLFGDYPCCSEYLESLQTHTLLDRCPNCNAIMDGKPTKETRACTNKKRFCLKKVCCVECSRLYDSKNENGVCKNACPDLRFFRMTPREVDAVCGDVGYFDSGEDG